MGWTELLLGLLIFVVASVGGLLLVSLLLVTLPATYFLGDRESGAFWIGRHAVLRWTGRILKNLLGVVAVALGVVLAMPGIPGPGLLVILIGVMLLDFPGKRRLEQWLIRRPALLERVNRLRRRFRKPPFELDGGEEVEGTAGAGEDQSPAATSEQAGKRMRDAR